ncbi:MAG TPA: aromatic prenyltransferase [Candidatus Deferrimicrobium sp.]|nr:aromatic prenyltransferase [Candidatus Deferrimicrobium sp.]
MELKYDLNLEQLQADIIKAAEIAGISYDKKKIWAVLKAYEEFFLKSAVTFVTSTKPLEQRALAFRYVNINIPHNPHSIALENGFITEQNHPVDNLFSEITENYPIMGYGVDTDVAHGLSKIWTFFQIPQPLEKAYAMASLPESIKRYAAYFQKYDLTVFHLFALDYSKKTLNLYFMVKEQGKFPPEKVAGMLRDLNFKVPTQEVLEHCSQAITIYYTFTWDSPRVERVCFGVIAPELNQIPTHLHPLIKKYVEQAPILIPNRLFIYGLTFAPTSDYIKVENDYSGSMAELMTHGAQAEVWLDEMKRRTETQIQHPEASQTSIMWTPAISELFDNIVAGIPEAFRQIVKPLLRETAEKKCQNGTPLTEANLISALFEITPDPFKPEAINNLKALGIEYQKYI